MAAEPFSRSEGAAVIALGISTGCIAALQPLLLGGLQKVQQITTAEMGMVSTAESLGSVAVLTLATLFLRPGNLRLVSSAALMLSFVINSLTGFLEGWQILLLRGLNGMCSGLLVWILVGFLSRATNPGRIFALYITSQAVLTFVLAQVLSRWLLPAFGPVGAYAMFAASNMVLLAMSASLLPKSYETGNARGTAAPPLHGLFGLLSVGFLLAAIMGFWVYVFPLGVAFGHQPDILNSALSAAIGIQILAGLFAVFLSGRVSPDGASLIAIVSITLAIALFFSRPDLTFFTLGLFAFVWMFIPAFQLPLLLDLDPSARTGLFVGTAQQLGIALGPFISSRLVDKLSLSSVLLGSFVCVIASVCFLAAAKIMAPGDNDCHAK